MKELSSNGLSLIKSFEGCHLTAYDDLQPKVKLTSTTKIKGTLTIGWGHTGNVKIGQTISQQQADYLLVNDLKRYVDSVNNPNIVPFTKHLNQNEFDALVSFCYNCGAGNLKILCSSTIGNIPFNIVKYNKSKGQTLAGLVHRREAEKQLFLAKPKEETTMSTNIEKKILELENSIKKLEQQVTQNNIKLKEVAAPTWITKEFPDALSYINQSTGTHDFWRAVVVALRILNK